MTKEELISHTERLIVDTKTNPTGTLSQAKEFLKTYAGPENQFLKTLQDIPQNNTIANIIYQTSNVLKAFKDYVSNDLLRSVSLEREIQIETISDYLDQAQKLLNDSKVHPAAATVIIGASLEEFLRNWIVELGTDLNTIKNSLDSYAQELKSKEKINKQDLKDIVSWAGIRNDAAHGHWENVNDKNRIKIMLEGINLFIRKYS